MPNQNQENWKRFLEWVNNLSPWNLWHPQNWQEKKELNPKVKLALDGLLKSEKQKYQEELIEKIEKMYVSESKDLIPLEQVDIRKDQAAVGFNQAIDEILDLLKGRAK